MKRIATLTATVALMINLSVAGIYAQQGNVKMTVSGTNVATTIDMQPGTITDEVNFTGNGTLGPFTYRELHADAVSPQSSSGCAGGAGIALRSFSLPSTAPLHCAGFFPRMSDSASRSTPMSLILGVPMKSV